MSRNVNVQLCTERHHSTVRHTAHLARDSHGDPIDNCLKKHAQECSEDFSVHIQYALITERIKLHTVPFYRHRSVLYAKKKKAHPACRWTHKWANATFQSRNKRGTRTTATYTKLATPPTRFGADQVSFFCIRYRENPKNKALDDLLTAKQKNNALPVYQ